jgi:adenosine deaminase
VATRAAYAFTTCSRSSTSTTPAACALRRPSDDFYELARAYFERAAADGVVHAELFFDPQTHTGRGVAFATVFAGLARAMDDARAGYGIVAS